MSRAGPAAALATAGLVVAVDQGTKRLVDSSIDRGDSVNVFFGLDLTNTRNTGVAFGALEGAGLIVAILIGLSLVLLIGYFVANRHMPWLWLP
ncbi:MAG TPA: signal peptidase II, partial [Thermoleophilaceae bacterium]|nr:signal peptidase II [Thermoleophilaceae bacterium]